MKSKVLIRSIFSALLCCCYLAAIVGIDIHVDHHNGEVFVVSLLKGADCESIHPEDECHCLDHHHGDCHEDDEDCENIVDVITLTGTHGNFHFSLAQDICYTSPVETPCLSVAAESLRLTRPVTKAPPRQSLSLFCVLRA